MSLRDHVSVPALPVDRWVAWLFVAAIALPLVLTLATIQRTAADDPKRGLAPWPAPVSSSRDAGRWTPAFRRWFEDHYALRRVLIRAHGTLMLEGVGVSPSTTVLAGRDGWWFYTDDGAMDDIVSATPMSEPALARWAESLDDNRAWLAGQGIPYVFVLTPDKHAVYPEFLPATVRRLGPWRGAQFAREMSRRVPGIVVSLEDALVARKAVERVYHRTDTHWNARGAFEGWRELARWLQHRGVPVSVDEHEPTAAVVGGQDLPRMLGLETLVSEERLDLVPRTPRRARVVEPAGADIAAELGRLVTEHPDRSLPRMVIFRDSFMTALMPYLAEQCSRCVFLWEKDLNPEVITQEQPDVVVHQMVGRRLQTYLPYNPFRP